MILESRIKQTALMVAVDICLKKKLNNAPARCARNLTELGCVAFPGRLSTKERDEFNHQILELCKVNDTDGARNLFMDTFLQE